MIIENGILDSVSDKDIVDGKFIVPEGITEIGKSAFYGRTELKSIEFPKTLKKIGDMAFCECFGLKEVEIPDTVFEIGSSAFLKCDNLEKVKLPKNLKKIESDTFYFCTSLKEIEIPEEVSEIGQGAFKNCISLRKIKIPKKITEIEAYTFGKNYELQEIEFPENLRKIEIDAFKDCYELKNIKLPESLFYLSDKAFENCSQLKNFKIPENCIRFKNIKENGCFNYSSSYGLNKVYDFLEKAVVLLGIDETEKLAKMPNLTEDEIKKYSLEKEKAIQELYETKSKITGDLGVTLQILRNLKLGEKQKNVSEKNNFEMQMFKYINEQFEKGYDGNFTDLMKNAFGNNATEETINEIMQLEKTLNKKLIKENLSKIKEKVNNAISATNEQYPISIVEDQVKPIRKMIEDALISEFSSTGKIEDIEEIISEKLEHANAPYIRQNVNQIVSLVSDLFESDTDASAILNKNCINAIKNTKENIGTAWKFKLNKTLNQLGYSFDSMPEELPRKDAEKLVNLLNEKSDKNIELEITSVAVPKEGIERKEACKILEQKKFPKFITYLQLCDMFKSVKEPYSNEFKKYYKAHRDEFLYNPEIWPEFGIIVNNFDRIIKLPELKNTYEKGNLQIEGILAYFKNEPFNNVRPGNEKLCQLSRTIADIYTEEEFEYVQKIFEITKNRESTSIPPVYVENRKLRGRMLAPDDVLNLFAGNITTCCQRFKGAGEGSMLLGSTEQNAGIFLVEQLDEKGEVENIVCQSLAIRQEGENGQFDRLTFDSIEMASKIKDNLSKTDIKEILQIYKEAGKQAIEKDKKFLENQVKFGNIARRDYDNLVLKEVILGRGLKNNWNAIKKLKKAKPVVPKEAFYEYQGINGKSIYPWIDSANRIS